MSADTVNKSIDAADARWFVRKVRHVYETSYALEIENRIRRELARRI